MTAHSHYYALPSRTTGRYFHIFLFFLFYHMACISNCCFYDNCMLLAVYFTLIMHALNSACMFYRCKFYLQHSLTRVSRLLYL